MIEKNICQAPINMVAVYYDGLEVVLKQVIALESGLSVTGLVLNYGEIKSAKAAQSKDFIFLGYDHNPVRKTWWEEKGQKIVELRR